MKDRLKNIRLVVSDIDGTLLTSDNALHAASLDAIRSFNQNEVCNFTLSTGRAFPLAKPFMDLLGLCAPFVFSGGAVFDPVGAQVLPLQTMTQDMLAPIMQCAEEFGLGLIGHTKSEMLCQMNEADWQRIIAIEWIKGEHIDHAMRVHDLAEAAGDSLLRIDFFSEDKDLNEIYAQLPQEITRMHTVLMNRSIELTPPGVNKGSALHMLSARIGIDLSQVMAIGDSMNDIALLQEAGVGVAMGTAPDALKAIADIIVPSSDDGGFADALDFLPYFSRI